MIIALGLPGLAASGSAAADPASGAPAAAAWTVTQVPLPAGAVSNSFRPTAVSCPSSRHCYGGGSFAELQVWEGGLLQASGKTWTAAQAPLPANATKGLQHASVGSIACPEVTRCYAGGTYEAGGNNGKAMILTRSGSAWSAAQLRLPAGANVNSDPTVSGTSCPTTTWCTAVGQYSAGSSQFGLLARRAGGKWTTTAAPVPAGAEPVASLRAVSCPSTTRCFAGGWQYAGPLGQMSLLMVTWNQKKWSGVKVPLPAGAADDPQASIQGISCPSITRCLAVGNYQDAAGNSEGILLTWSGKAWRARTAPLPANAGTNPWAELNAISCPSTTRCVVGGSYEDGASTPFGLLLTWSGGVWKAAAAPTATYDLYALSCPTTARCVALGGAYGNPVALTGP